MILDPSPNASVPMLILGLVVNLAVLAALAVVLVLDLKYIRNSRRLAQQIGLPQGQWLRPVKILFFDPAIYLLVVGLVLAQDIIENWEHLVAGLAGAAAGVLVGRYRYGIQYVRTLPEYKSIVFVRSRAEYVALVVLMVFEFVSEQQRIAVVGPLTLLITFLLSLVVFESIARSVFCFRRYRQDIASVSRAA